MDPIKYKPIIMKGKCAVLGCTNRKHNDVGYHIDNIQMLTKRDNIIKYFSYDYRNKKSRGA